VHRLYLSDNSGFELSEMMYFLDVQLLRLLCAYGDMQMMYFSDKFMLKLFEVNIFIPALASSFLHLPAVTQAVIIAMI